jgi:hypothetical protein
MALGDLADFATKGFGNDAKVPPDFFNLCISHGASV